MKDWFFAVGYLQCSHTARNREPSSRGASNKSDLTSADSWLQLDLEIALSDAPASNAFGVETSGDVIKIVLKG
jgi:hypothetical protein